MELAPDEAESDNRAIDLGERLVEPMVGVAAFMSTIASVIVNLDKVGDDAAMSRSLSA